MNNNMIWAYYLMLSNHMWDDENVPPRYWYQEPKYKDNNNVDFKLWDEMVTFLKERGYNTIVVDVGDGVKFNTHPEISAPDAVSVEYLKKKLDEMRSLGITPIPKLNFSTCHHTWLKEYRYMVGTQKYIEVCTDLISETCQIFDHPTMFHLGMDEEDDIGGHRFRSMVTFRREEMLWRDYYRFFDTCEKEGVRPWVWSDYYWHNKELFIKHMPKSVMQSNWFYYYFKEYPEDQQNAKAIRAFEELNSLGYEQIPTCSTWANNDNPDQLIAHCRKYLDPRLCKGFMTASWARTERDCEYTLKNDAHRLFIARKKHYPETIECKD